MNLHFFIPTFSLLLLSVIFTYGQDMAPAEKLKGQHAEFLTAHTTSSTSVCDDGSWMIRKSMLEEEENSNDLQSNLFVLVDVNGQVLYSKIDVVECESAILKIAGNQQLPNGIYFVQGTNARDKVYRKKVLITDQL